MPGSGPYSRPVIRTVLHGPEYLKPKPLLQRILPSQRIEASLRTPTWSVRSLLPTAEDELRSSTSGDSGEITREKLHHLLNLSALPLPKSPAEEQRLLKTLRAQIHFVREIQKVDTTGVEPLRAIRDETAEHEEQSMVTLDDFRDALAQEEVVGRNGRIRRKVTLDNQGNEIPFVDQQSLDAQRWPCFAMGQEEVKGEVATEDLIPGETPEMKRAEVPGRVSGRYFVVKKGKKEVEKGRLEATDE